VIARWYLRRIDAEFVERYDALTSVADAERLIAGARAGRSYIMFPEGTFTRAPGLAPFHLGAFEMAAKAGLPIIPIAIRGSRSVLRDGQWWPRRGPIVIEIGSAIRPIENTDIFSAAVKLRDVTRVFIRQRCGEPDLQR
jgi:1-acyl-sn-glycerol-3-phosphate acyltransferase